MDYAAVLLDLIKAFDRVPHDVLLFFAIASGRGDQIGDSLWLLRVSLAAYRTKRTVRMEGVYSRFILAVRGMTAGAGHAVIEIRLLFLNLMDGVSAMPRQVPLYITLYVDDATFEAMGTWRFVVQVLSAAVRRFNAILNASCRMALYFDKNVVIASVISLARQIASECGDDPKLHPAQWAASLGAAIAGGKRSGFQTLRKRLANFKLRIGKFNRARRNKVSIERVHRTGGSADMTYGEGVAGVPPYLLHQQRVALAAKLGTDTKGGSTDMKLFIVDGTGSSQFDPVFAAHTQPICLWANALWSRWFPAGEFAEVFKWAARRVDNAKRPWSVVGGPCTGLITSAARLSWRMRSYHSIRIPRRFHH